MRFEIKEWYSDEAKAKLEVMNALAGQVSLRGGLVRDQWVETHDPFYDGAVAAYNSMSHTLGEMAARLIMNEVREQRAGNR